MPFTQTFAEPITPLTSRVAVCPAARFGVKSVRHHQGTLNRLDRVRPDLAHEAVAELHVVREVHAVRAAAGLVHRLQRGVARAEAVLGERLDLGAWSTRVVVGDRHPARRVEAWRGDLGAGLRGRRAALHLPAAGAEVRDVARAGIGRRGEGRAPGRARRPWLRPPPAARSRGLRRPDRSGGRGRDQRRGAATAVTQNAELRANGHPHSWRPLRDTSRSATPAVRLWTALRTCSR